VVIIDDHGVSRRGILALLEAEESFTVVGEAGDRASGMEVVRAHDPELIVLDINLDGDNALPLIPRIKDLASGARVLVVTMEKDVSFARVAFDLGAGGYVLKGSPPEELVRAASAVADGRTYLDQALGALLTREQDAAGKAAGLTQRELQVLAALAEGLTNAQVAHRLSVGVRTIEAHRASLKRKLGGDDRAALVRHARRLGLHGSAS